MGAESGYFYQEKPPIVYPFTGNTPTVESSNPWQRELHSSKRKKIAREVVGSEAFNLETSVERKVVTKEQLKDDIISYLGEYRFQIPKFEYKMIFGKDAEGNGSLEIRDPHTRESMEDKSDLCIREREEKRLPTHREKAEKEGLQALNVMLPKAREGQKVFWMSPPGPKEQGYGEYGFVYVGDLKQQEKEGEFQLSMQAIRVDSPTMTQFNKVKSILSKEGIVDATAEDHLRSPRIISEQLSTDAITDVLKQNFTFQLDENKQKQFSWIIEQLDELIDDLGEVMLSGTNTEKIEAMHKVENYFIKLAKEAEATSDEVVIFSKKQRIRLSTLGEDYNHIPPIARGSCGATGKTNRLFGSSSTSLFFGTDSKGSLQFSCPHCGHTNTRPYEGFRATCEKCTQSVRC